MANHIALCTNCNAQIVVDDNNTTSVCEYCGTTFITEHAINNYTLQNADIDTIRIGGVVVLKEIGSRIISFLQSNNQTEAIKILRESAGLSLKDAKDAIDAYSGGKQEFVKAKIRVNKKIIWLIIILILLLQIFRTNIENYIDSLVRPIAYKPVIYLYPESSTEVEVKLDLNGELKCTYPEYNDGWNVLARPDGTLIDLADNEEYSYLFWEGTQNTEYDMSKGFVVKGEDTAKFLQTTLKEMGLTPKEYNEFIVYWLPQMQDNPYNLITFQQEVYTDNAVLDITPTPDSVLRVFMVFQPLENYIEVEEPILESFERVGFTVVEWGGCQVTPYW